MKAKSHVTKNFGVQTKSNSVQIQKILTFSKILVALSLISITSSSIAFPLPHNQSLYRVPGGWNIAEYSKYGQYAGQPYKNVHIYRLRNEDTFMQVVDLAGGGHVKLLQYPAPSIVSPDGTKTFKGWWRGDLNYWWKEIGTDSSSRVSLVNGQYFNPQTDTWLYYNVIWCQS